MCSLVGASREGAPVLSVASKEASCVPRRAVARRALVVLLPPERGGWVLGAILKMADVVLSRWTVLVALDGAVLVWLPSVERCCFALNGALLPARSRVRRSTACVAPPGVPSKKSSYRVSFAGNACWNVGKEKRRLGRRAANANACSKLSAERCELTRGTED